MFNKNRPVKQNSTFTWKSVFWAKDIWFIWTSETSYDAKWQIIIYDAKDTSLKVLRWYRTGQTTAPVIG